MNMQTSQLAAALMSGTNNFSSAPSASGIPDNSVEEPKKENQNDTQKDSTFEEKEEIASGEDFSDEVLN